MFLSSQLVIIQPKFSNKILGVEAERYGSALDLAKYLVERDTSWETTYPGIDQGKPKLYKHGGSPNAEKGVGEEHTVISLGQGEQQTTTPLFLATKTGCAEIVEEILKIYPQAIEHIDEEGRNILHIAIKYRHLKIFQLVAKREVPMKRMVQKVDKEGNSILHTAGLKVKDYLPGRMKGPALILQEELLWFEVVHFQ
ncbi:hypothetical protein CJ030_MR2G018491 [Morella rubra]|uniref:Uncharacterized protein n=1 Tax=Morella rubra TaxID=262757 RepID=A0A6A1W9Q8_9ROSI|nr:hypothetical protein CJ030_MR2G018491 [Morella rubra]